MSAAVQDLARLRGAAQVEAGQAFDRPRALSKARELLAPSLKGRDAPAYPLAALGCLAPAAAEIAEHGQMQPALVGQSLLGAASLLVQGLFNVRTLAGIKPLSLYLLTLGESGDGKSTADAVAMQSIKDWQREAGERYQTERRQHAAECKALKRDDTEPDPPRSPYRLVRDATVEGLRRDLEHGPAAQGLFTDEAAAMLAGYGMSAEHKSKTAATFSGLWDTGDLSVSRSMGGRIELHGRRLAMHWLIQPHAAAAALGDPLLSALGFWPRFLLAWPAACEPRKDRPFRPELLPAVVDYWQRCGELLAEPLPGDCSTLPVIELQDEARQMIGQAFERMEVEARRGRLQVVKPFALRATEQACRVAGVLAAFEGRPTISADDARCALDLTRYSIATWRAVIDEGAADLTGADALRLFEWLTDDRKCAGWKADGRRILQAGPACVRAKDRRDAAVDMLTAAGLAERGDRGMVYALDPSAEEGGARGTR
jgi:hypothetical protein